MPPRWSYLLTDLRTTQSFGRVPFTGVSFDQALDGKGSFTGKTPSSHPAWSDRMSNDLFRRVIWPMRNARPVGAFVFAAMPGASMIDDVRPVRAVPLSTLLMRRLIQHTLAYNQVDQNDIQRDLIRYALGRDTVFAQANAALPGPGTEIPWIRLDATTSGVLRDRLETPGNTDDGYTEQGRKVVGTCLDNLRDLQDGAEFRWLYGLDPSTGLPFMQLDTGGPSNEHRVGRPPGEALQMVLEFPSRTVSQCDYGADGETIVTRSHVVGQDREGVRPIGVWTVDELLDRGYPLLESVWSESVQEQSTLDAKAFARRSGASESFALTLNGNGPPTFTTYGLGDHAALRVRRADRKKLPDWPIRITGWNVSVPDSGVDETVEPTVEVLIRDE